MICISFLRLVSVLIVVLVLIAILLPVLVVVLVLIVVLIPILVIVLILIVVLISVLVVVLILIHDRILLHVLFGYRGVSMTRFSGFILWLKEKSSQHAKKHSGSDTACGCFQSAGQCTQQPVLCHGFFHAFCQCISKTGQRNGGAGAAPIDKRLVKAKRTQNDTGYYIQNQNSGRCQFGFVDQNLTDDA